jgi:electron transfer flavoprotein-quinone oxidoreductase
MDNFDVIVVGGGLSGLSAAYCLAKEGIGVLVIERGDYSGAKNVTGGRLYLQPVRQYLPELFDSAPLERYVTKERICMMSRDSSVTLELNSGKFAKKPYHSYTVLRARLDQWLADKVGEAGGMIVTKQRVDELIKDGEKVRGIVAGEDKIPANVVLAADGTMSLIAEKAGLRKPHEPTEFAVGIKEVIELKQQTLEERFNLRDGEGLAEVFAGAVSQGMFGGGFLYTNISSVSIGLVVRISDLMKRPQPIEAPQLFEDFLKRPEIRPLIEGGEMVEYSAHVIPEAGFAGIPKLYGDGILVSGDAAGFTLNAGITVRGMEFAIVSGVLAAKAIAAAVKKGDYSAATLSQYETLLKDSFVLKDLETFKDSPHILDNPRLMSEYPELACGVMEQLMYIGETPKKKLSSTAIAAIRKNGITKLAKDGFGMLRM